MTELKADTTLSKIFLAAHETEKDKIANLANAAAVLMQFVPDINWAGFYLLEKESGDLVLGPFQGLSATPRIKQDSGVVGTTFTKQTLTIVPDVHQFAGHIACDRSQQVDTNYLGSKQMFSATQAISLYLNCKVSLGLTVPSNLIVNPNR